MKTIFDAFDDEDWGRLKMGRFSEADEKMIERMVRGRSVPSAFSKIFGGGADMSRPAYSSSRARSSNGARSFHLQMTAHGLRCP